MYTTTINQMILENRFVLNRNLRVFVLTNFLYVYPIAGNFGEVFNLTNWQFYGKSPNSISAIFHSDEICRYVYVLPVTGVYHVAKFKTQQFVLGTDSPNLMLAKVSRYTVY